MSVKNLEVGLRIRGRKGIFWVLVTSLFFGTTLAFSDEPGAYHAALARAIAAKERAMDRNDPAIWEDALLRFQGADRIRSTKETQYEIALAASRLRQDDIAVESYEAAIDLGLEGGALEKARAFLSEKRSFMGRLAIRGPAETRFSIGMRQGTLPLSRPMVLFPGSHTVRAIVNGQALTRTVLIDAGGAVTLDLEAAGKVERTDKKLSDTGTTQAPPRTDRGTAQSIEQERAIPWMMLGVGRGLAVLGGGMVIGSSVLLGSSRDDLSDLCAVPNGRDSCSYAYPGKQQEAKSQVDRIATLKAFRTGGWIGLGTGAALAGVGGFMLASGSAEEQSVSMVMIPMPGALSIGIAGKL